MVCYNKTEHLTTKEKWQNERKGNNYSSTCNYDYNTFNYFTIEVLIGKDGIISKTAETKQATEISSEKEKIQLAVIQTAHDNKSLKIEVDKLNQNLINVFGKDETA